MFIEAWIGGDATSAHHQTEKDFIEDFARSSLHEPSFDFTTEISRPWARLWTARAQAGSPVLGFLISWHVADELHILSVAVSPEARRHGIARALMNAALDYGRTKLIRLVLLEVRRSNRPAIKLYRSFSFSAMGVRPNYYADTNEDAVEMMVSLDPDSGALITSRDEVRIDD